MCFCGRTFEEQCALGASLVDSSTQSRLLKVNNSSMLKAHASI